MTAFSQTNRIYPFLFLNLGACLSALPPASAQSSLIERIQKTENTIVTIEAQKLDLGQTGAGVIIDPARYMVTTNPVAYVVTNTHTILYAQFIFVTLQDGTRLPASIASIAPDSDFTILKINSPSPLKAIPWADSQNVQWDDKIIAIGNSALWKETISEGKIKSIGRSQSEAGQMIEVLETDLNLDNGDSGGPILDRNGNFLGIVVAKNTRMDRSSYVIPSNKIREHFLKYLSESRHYDEK